MARPKTCRKVARSAVTGRFVKKSYAKRNPSRTVVESVPCKPRKKK